MKKIKQTAEEKREAKRDRKLMEDLKRRARAKGALIE